MKLYKSIKFIGVVVAVISLSIGATFTMAIDFTDPEVNGTYYGFVHDGATPPNPVGYLSMKISKKGKFSGRLYGYGGAKARMKGSFDTQGKYIGKQYDADGLNSNANMNIYMGSYGLRIAAVLESPDGQIQSVELTRRRYSKTDKTVLAGNYTFLSPAATLDDPAVPAGDGLAYGKVGPDGKTKIKGYSNAGNKYTYSGYILEGDTLAFFVQPKNKRREMYAGILEFSDVSGTSDISGLARYSQESGSAGVPYSSGYDQTITYMGSRYTNTGFVQLPVGGFTSTANNSIANFAGGNFNGTNYVFTWETKGKMTAPKVPTYSTKAKFKNKTGMFTGKYTFRDPSLSFAALKSTIRGVVFQKQDLVSGQAITRNESERYAIAANLGGEVAPTTVVYPRTKKVSAVEQVYSVEITLPNDMDWQVEIPSESDWIEAEPALGRGSGTVIITVRENRQNFIEREAVIKIAGLGHEITQRYYDLAGNDDISLIPRSRLVAAPWDVVTTYPVTVNAPVNRSWAVSIPTDIAGWVIVEPSQGSGPGAVIVTVAPYAIDFIEVFQGDFREGTITIAGRPHDIRQWAALPPPVIITN